MDKNDFSDIKDFLGDVFGSENIEGPKVDINSSVTDYAININGLRHILGFSREFLEDSSEKEILKAIQTANLSLALEKRRVSYLIMNSGVEITEF